MSKNLENFEKLVSKNKSEFFKDTVEETFRKDIEAIRKTFFHRRTSLIISDKHSISGKNKSEIATLRMILKSLDIALNKL